MSGSRFGAPVAESDGDQAKDEQDDAGYAHGAW
jgi:hypothetical protein